MTLLIGNGIRLALWALGGLLWHRWAKARTDAVTCPDTIPDWVIDGALHRGR